MLTFEKVLEIFADYLTADETIEVYISRHGCVRVEFDQDFHYCSGEVRIRLSDGAGQALCDDRAK